MFKAEPRRRIGWTLVTLLVVTSIMGSIIHALLTELRQTRQTVNEVQAQWLADAAVERAKSPEACCAVNAVNGMFGHGRPQREKNAPGCTYCQPQVASIGMTEEKARAEGHELKIGRFPFRAIGKAVAAGETEGMVKLIFDARYGELLGAHILGSEATELIAPVDLDARARELRRVRRRSDGMGVPPVPALAGGDRRSVDGADARPR